MLVSDRSWCGPLVQDWQTRALELGWPEGPIGSLEHELLATAEERAARGHELLSAVGRPLAVLVVTAEVIVYRDASGQGGAIEHPAQPRGWSASSWAPALGIPAFVDPPRAEGLPSCEALRSRSRPRHVRAKGAEASPAHRCHARGCRAPCPPERLMCGPHWRMVPADLQRAVWAAYRPGQCDDKSPSAAWHEAADAAIAAVAEAEAPAPSSSLSPEWRALADAAVAEVTSPTSPELLWVDCETTGQSAAQHQIIEFAVAITDLSGAVLRAPAAVLVGLEPWSVRDLRAMAVHGIDWRASAFARAAKPMRLVLARAIERLRGRRLAGHNVGFDAGFLRAACGRVGIAVPVELEAEPLCTLKLARAAKKRGALLVESCSLESLRQHFGVGHQAHRAAGDVAATIEIYRRLRGLGGSASLAL